MVIFGQHTDTDEGGTYEWTLQQGWRNAPK